MLKEIAKFFLRTFLHCLIKHYAFNHFQTSSYAILFTKLLGFHYFTACGIIISKLSFLLLPFLIILDSGPLKAIPTHRVAVIGSNIYEKIRAFVGLAESL